jgi:penicillin-binding protein 1A
MTSLLRGVVTSGTGSSIGALGVTGEVAGKTGTTNDFSDAWFIGYTPNLATGVWVGFDDLRSLGETESGAHAALPIWLDYMLPALEPLPVMPFEIPEEIVFVRIDPKTGLLTPDQGDQGTVEMFTKGSEPTQTVVQRADPAFFYSMDQIGEAVAGPGQN